MLDESRIMPRSNHGWWLSEFFWIALFVVVVGSLSIVVRGYIPFVALFACVRRVVDTSMFRRTVASPEIVNG
jgi:hypothetical protein